jgi:translation initiation factor 2B subunit (eIF-2B alpha/beta/delta family)/ADP-ribose pyrophosphatase YjhB (NUDIX family)
MAHVVTCFLRNRAEVLLARRSDQVGSYPGLWAGVSGYAEDGPTNAVHDAWRELREETSAPGATLVRSGTPVEVRDGDMEWTVHPFLFDVPTRDVSPNEELAEVEWVSPTAMLDRETVPGLWDVYMEVAPSVESVASDSRHGSAFLSIRALEILRDRAAVAPDWDSVAAVARDLRDARPGMAAVANRINRVLFEADRDPDAVHVAAIDALDRALDADDAAARTATEYLDGTVVTLSRSGTVISALLLAMPEVLVATSNPGGEGVGVAETLARSDLDVTLTSDAALAHLLGEGEADVALVGADAILADGSVVNKVGTRSLALAAAREEVPLYVVSARDKIRADESFSPETRPATDLYDGRAPVSVANPAFDRTPADLVDGVATEDGLLDHEAIRDVAAQHREYATWDSESDR